jgi:hypothetical protein
MKLTVACQCETVEVNSWGNFDIQRLEGSDEMSFAWTRLGKQRFTGLILPHTCRYLDERVVECLYTIY